MHAMPAMHRALLALAATASAVIPRAPPHTRKTACERGSGIVLLEHADGRAPVEAVTANPAEGVRSARLNWLVRSVYIGDTAARRMAR